MLVQSVEKGGREEKVFVTKSLIELCNGLFGTKTTD